MSSILKDVTNSHLNAVTRHSASPSQREKPEKTIPDSSLFVLPLAQPHIVVKEKTVVIPIPPEEASTELKRIHECLLRLFRGMSAWMAMHESMSKTELETVKQKIQEVESLFGQTRALHAIHDQFGTQKELPHHGSGGEKSAEDLISTEAGSVDRPSSIFAPPEPQDSQLVRPPSVQLPTAPQPDTMRLSLFGSNRTAAGSPPLRRRPVSAGKFSLGRLSWPPKERCWVAIVEFKRQRMKRCVSERLLDPGTYVIVPGDRGYDCGLVVQCGVWDPAMDGFDAATLRTMEASPLPLTRMRGEVVPVMREATTEEVHQLYGDQASKERLALKTCRELVLKLGLEMTVVDCEYQFDGTKISFYFEADRSIDFRDLNRELFRIFNARIWMENVNNGVKNVIPEGAISKSDKIQFQCSGLRLPPH
ncbi:unnamed protein product [Phytomonas sp. EM1]|nr:unnamed protein product [Phytomonas sp. EM1]|eukprot:CCW62804.1 unnamed protein product [Phytomonas sp. isolate EM1]